MIARPGGLPRGGPRSCGGSGSGSIAHCGRLPERWPGRGAGSARRGAEGTVGQSGGRSGGAGSPRPQEEKRGGRATPSWI